ncbi:hypothetical protein [Acidipropionibacterium jensenii]|nr:hypothetical protein [Acidipropionibacterium jensenii]
MNQLDPGRIAANFSGWSVYPLHPTAEYSAFSSSVAGAAPTW